MELLEPQNPQFVRFFSKTRHVEDSIYRLGVAKSLGTQWVKQILFIFLKREP